MVVLLGFFAGGSPMPRVVKAGKNREDAVCMGGIQPNKGPTEEVSRSEHRVYFMIEKVCVSPLLSDTLQKG